MLEVVGVVIDVPGVRHVLLLEVSVDALADADEPVLTMAELSDWLGMERATLTNLRNFSVTQMAVCGNTRQDMLNEQDQERFVRLWTSAQPAVANFVHALVRDHGIAQDVLQETAMVLYRRFAEYDCGRPFIAWALGIARFQVMSVRRDEARSLVAFDDEVLAQFTETWAELAPSVSERGVRLQNCIERLTDRAGQVVQLRYFEDLNAEQIAQRLGTNGATVRVTLQRIREQLRACVERGLQSEGGTP